jgi:hypothetical protein
MISNSTIIFEKIDDAKKKMEITGSNAISLNEYFHPELLVCACECVKQRSASTGGWFFVCFRSLREWYRL